MSSLNQAISLGTQGAQWNLDPRDQQALAQQVQRHSKPDGSAGEHVVPGQLHFRWNGDHDSAVRAGFLAGFGRDLQRQFRA